MTETFKNIVQLYNFGKDFGQTADHDCHFKRVTLGQLIYYCCSHQNKK